MDKWKSMEHRWNDTKRKSEIFAENHIEVLLCPPHIPHGLDLDWTRTSATRRRRLTFWAMAPSLQCAVFLHPPLSCCLLVPNILVRKLFTSNSGRKTPSLTPIQINTSFGIPNKRCFLLCWLLYDYRTSCSLYTCYPEIYSRFSHSLQVNSMKLNANTPGTRLSQALNWF